MTFEPRYLVCITTTGEYRISYEQGGWLAQWVGPGNATLGRWSRPIIAIDARDTDGNAHDWESLEQAQEACEAHRFRVARGLGPQEAADEVAAYYRTENGHDVALIAALEEA